MEPLSEDDAASHLPRGQEGLHPDLARIVRRHLEHADRAPVPEHTRAAYAALKDILRSEPRPLVLDSGCGTGSATVALAELHPEAWVIGVDQSLHRLRKGPAREGLRRGPVAQVGRALLLRGDVPALWRLMAGDGVQLAAHYLLYPNPWPKKRHLMRRWHGHPAFGALLALGGALELRTNWAVYAEELAAALEIAGRAATCEPWRPTAPLSRFEAKYLASGHALLRVRADLGATAR